ncbi:MAG: hypothetical protein PSV16_04890 [Flavobacterium sp.]|nr:hypothetical protein [Flavobacterium sp.]
MNRLILYFALAATGLCMQCTNAQESNKTTPTEGVFSTEKYAKDEQKFEAELKKNRIANLKKEIQEIPVNEKYKLTIEVERINDLLSKGKITEEEAKSQKEKAARNAALNIDSKTLIAENQLSLLERDEYYPLKYDRGSYVELGFGNAYDEGGSALFGLHYHNANKKPKFDKRTYSDIVIAFGFNNTIREGESFGKSPYQFLGSTFAEFGFAFRTRLLKKTNHARLVYGLSLQFNKLEIKDNKHFVDTGDQTVLEDTGLNLKTSRMRFDYLVVPLHLEFGPSTKVEHKDYFRYKTNNKFKYGIGGYAGVNLGLTETLRYKFDGQNITDKTKQNFNSSKFIYGLSAYIGVGSLSFYIKYDLNPMFQNADKKQHNISFGYRFDL